MARKWNGREVFTEPSITLVKNGIGSGPAPIGHLRRRTLEIGQDADARPEIPTSQQKDGRKA